LAATGIGIKDIEVFWMKKQDEKQRAFYRFPACAEEYIKQVLKKMRYRRKVRQDVQAELAAHFEDELQD
jgi:hypothetical protein